MNMALTPWTKAACRYAATSAGRVLAGRPFLPGSDRKGFPKHLAEPCKGYPHVVEPQDFGIPPGASPYLCAELIK